MLIKIPARSCQMLRKRKESTELAANDVDVVIMIPKPKEHATLNSDDKGKAEYPQYYMYLTIKKIEKQCSVLSPWNVARSLMS